MVIMCVKSRMNVCVYVLQHSVPLYLIISACINTVMFSDALLSDRCGTFSGRNASSWPATDSLSLILWTFIEDTFILHDWFIFDIFWEEEMEIRSFFFNIRQHQSISDSDEWHFMFSNYLFLRILFQRFLFTPVLLSTRWEEIRRLVTFLKKCMIFLITFM